MILISQNTFPAYSELAITPGDLYEAMGYGAHTPDADICRISESILTRAARLTRPCFCFYPAEGQLEDEILHLSAASLGIGKIISRQLRGSERFIIFAATAGEEYETWMNRLKEEGDMVALYMADSLGSIIAERTADRMEMALEQKLQPERLLHTNRFSPGYCGWHVSEQHRLFSLFPAPHPCGIQLTDSSLMLPIKSVSGIIGIGSKVKKLEYSCGLCTLASCYRRKKKPDPRS